MLPETSIFSTKQYSIIKNPSNTFKIDFNKNRVRHIFTGIEALKQAVFKTLMTKRYTYVIYNWDYGIEIDDLIGMPKGYTKIELERRIKDALLQDDRIEDVYDFSFYDIESDKNALEVVFFIKSIFGTLDFDMEVSL